MPITLFATDGVLSDDVQQQVFADLTTAFLEHHKLVGNTFLTPNVIGEVSIIPKGKSFAGGKPADIVIVELKVPAFALGSAEQKAGFVRDATDIVQRATGGRQPKERIWVNMVYAVDGLWGLGGRAYENSELLDAVGEAARLAA